MNRRSFLRMIGVTALATVLPLPKTPVEELSQIVIPECPGCAAGLPIKKLGWVLYPPRVVILNDNIIEIELPEHKENGIGHSLYWGPDITGLDV